MDNQKVDDIIKALRKCRTGSCASCVYFKPHNSALCCDTLKKDAADALERILAADKKDSDASFDNVSRPSHYNREGAIQSIDEMIAVFGKEVVAHFCLCNVWKYRYRAADKNGAEDIAKSDWYMRKYIELTEGN